MITTVNLHQGFGPSAGLLVVQLGIVCMDRRHSFCGGDEPRLSPNHPTGVIASGHARCAEGKAIAVPRRRDESFQRRCRLSVG